MKLKYLLVIIAIFILTGLIYPFINAQEDLKVDHAKMNLERLPCEVYFFKRWGTYSHPVTPIEPIEYETAVMRDGFCLAWMCKDGANELFTKFQVRTNNITETDLVKPYASQSVEYYESSLNNGKLEIGRKINIDETIALKKFLISFPDSRNTMLANEQNISYTYRYIYNNDGSLKKVVITNMLGEENTLDY